MSRDTVRMAGVILAVCLALGLIEAAQLRLGTGPLTEGSWSLALWRVVPTWVVLAALSPVAILAADRWPIRGEEWRGALLRHLALALPFALAHLALTAVWVSVRPGSPGFGFLEGFGLLTSSYLVYGILSYGALVGVVHAYRYHREASSHRAETEAVLRELDRARRQALEGKLHPHFVFNTLNAITGLASRGDQRGVVRTLEAFSDLLQATLEENTVRSSTLGEELELLRRYLEIQKVRFGSRLEVRWEVDPEVLDTEVPTLVLQPLVENALHHAIGRSRTGGVVTIRCRRTDREVVAEVEDTGPGAASTPRSAIGGGHGIGLRATRARLASVVGPGARFELSDASDGSSGKVARISIPRPPDG